MTDSCPLSAASDTRDWRAPGEARRARAPTHWWRRPARVTGAAGGRKAPRGVSHQAGAALLAAMLTVTLVATFAAAAMWQQWRAIEVETAERARIQSAWILIPGKQTKGEGFLCTFTVQGEAQTFSPVQFSGTFQAL